MLILVNFLISRAKLKFYWRESSKFYTDSSNT